MRFDLIIDGQGGNDTITWDGASTLLSITALAETITINGDMATTLGAVSLTTERKISLTSGSSVTAFDGNVTLTANQQLTPSSGNFAGIDVNNATVQVTGTGGGSGISDGNYGVFLEDLSGAETAVISAGGAGEVTVTGIAGNAGGTGPFNIGVYLANPGASITSGGGDINVTGTGTDTANSNAISLIAGAAINSGSNAAINLTADSLNVAGASTIDSGTGATTILTNTSGTQINLGGGDVLTGSPLTLGLSDAELDLISAGTINIGDENTGTITVSAAI